MYSYSNAEKTNSTVTQGKSLNNGERGILSRKKDRGNPDNLSHLIITGNNSIQTKIKVGKPNDKYEQEADKVADKVMSSPMSANGKILQRQGNEKEEETQTKEIVQKHEEEEPQAKELISRQEEEEEEVQPKRIVQKQEEEEPQAKEQISKQEEEEEEAQPKRKVQKQEEEEEEAQPKLNIQRQEEQEDETVQTKAKETGKNDKKKTGIKYVVNIDNPEEEPKEELQTKSLGSVSKSQNTTASFDNKLESSKGGGLSLPKETSRFMESNFDSDFSGVRIHTDSNAAQMSSQINAQAFTHGNDIYFNEGKYNPGTSGGKNLIAHELTHTVQQGASVQKKSSHNKIQKNSSHVNTLTTVQRSWLGDAWDAVSDVASSAVDFVKEGLEAGLNFIKDKFHDFVKGIPGYSLLSVILAQDPISGDPVERSGKNFINAGLDIIPFGSLFKKKLEETGALEEAAVWLDNQIAGIEISLGTIKAEASAFWDSLSLSDIGDPTGVLNRAANIIRRPIGKIITFVGNVATEFLRIVKNYVLSELVLFIKNHTRGYPLLTVILSKDPITEEPVERNGMNLIKGFMLLSADGAEQLKQMEETGSLQKAADWIDITIAELDLSWDTIKTLFTNAWNLISIENLMKPIETFQKLVKLFADPVGRIIKFIIKVGLKILEFIKLALLKRLSTFARKTRGYHLVTVLLGKDPFTGEEVLRTSENVIRGFMSLMDGGEEQFQQMKQTGAIQRTVDRIEGAVARLGFTWEYITGLFKQAWNSFSLKDLAAPIEAFVRLVKLFGPPILRLFAFIWEVLKMVIEVLLIIMKFPIDLVSNIITKSMQAIEDIKKDPIGFLKNILRAIKQGFVNFFDNILKHLIKGVTGWLFGELKDAGINPPKDFTFKSVIGFVLEVLGITMDRIWKKLGDRIGHDKVEKIKGMLDKLEGIWTFIKDVATRGPIAIWEYIVEKLSNLWDTVLEAVRNWVVTKIIEKVVTKLLSMLDPTGIMAVVNSVIAIYNAIQSFIRYIKQMLEIVNSFVEGVAEIAKGNINRAAKFIEDSMSRAMPVAIGFLANQVGLGGIGKKVGEMIEKVREKVDSAIGWLIDKAISGGKAFLDMLKRGATAIKEGVAGLFKWWKKDKKFTDKNNKSHKIFYKGEGKNSKLVLASNIQNVNTFLDGAKVDGDVAQNKLVDDAKAKFRETEDEKDIMIGKQTQISALKQTDHKTKILRGEVKDHDKSLTIKFNSLSDILMKLNIDDPITELTPSKITKSGDTPPTWVESTPLTEIPGEFKGSQPGADPEDWLICDYINNSTLTPKGNPSIQWVRMHLLNDHLHGPGVKWNLTPGRQGTNDKMKRGGEKTAKEAVRKKEKKLYSYKTSITYHGGKVIKGLKDKNDPTSDEITLGNEKNFPSSISIEFGEAVKSNGNFTVTRSVVTPINDIKAPDPNEMDPAAIFSRIKDKVKSKVKGNRTALWNESVYRSLHLDRVFSKFNISEAQQKVLQKLHNPTDLDFGELLTLVVISETSAPTSTNIAANAPAAFSSVKRHIKNLVSLSYVEDTGEKDGRSTIYGLTGKGTKAVAAYNNR